MDGNTENSHTKCIKCRVDIPLITTNEVLRCLECSKTPFPIGQKTAKCSVCTKISVLPKGAKGPIPDKCLICKRKQASEKRRVPNRVATPCISCNAELTLPSKGPKRLYCDSCLGKRIRGGGSNGSS